MVQIGFSQRIQLDWLEKTSRLVLRDSTRDQIQVALEDLLKDQLSVGGTARWGNRGKAISILLQIWVTPSVLLKPLHAEGLELLKRLPDTTHLPVHWGMTVAAYPFVGIVAETVGRLLRLQGSFTVPQVQRRLREQLGERETVARAARRVLRCFVDWGGLQDTSHKGVYQPAPVISIDDRQLAAWLVEPILAASEFKSAPLRDITQSLVLFPFALPTITPGDLRSNNRLELFRQGLDEDIVRLRGAL